MRFFSENGYNIVTLDQALDHLAGRIKLLTRSIAITIDGGYQDAYMNVLPVLRKDKFHATFFIIPECIGGERKIMR
ncbi:MAG: polysaccharide deacetylase family protein [Deltaproteobacteria bacterium]|nr:polysaccharide deacetylase family protein [Deltaproteobacteria bacterium]